MLNSWKIRYAKKFIFEFNKVERFKLSLTKDGLHKRFLNDFVYILYNPLWLVRIFRSPILENTSWWLLLYVLEALVFQNSSKWLLLFSLSNRAIFFVEIFLFKESPKKRVPSFSLPWWKKIPSLPFIMFSCRHSSKTFHYR